ncbi:hypothetical protein MAR_015919 [Mya arenaria]|uniref:Uncharacterized protein n=1 Tax=Mya arenaria TaxID=6604 RepID=A0ABY7FIN0_MYAAR|nr:hypothetical protein MAR_015919 [Mya arenaria]
MSVDLEAIVWLSNIAVNETEWFIFEKGVSNLHATHTILEAKFSNIELDLKKLWTFVHEQAKEIALRVNSVEDRVSNLEFSLSTAQSEIDQLHKSEAKTKDDLFYVQSQSMRNNLIFGNIPEPQAETWEQSESTICDFMKSKLKIAEDLANSIKFERVHRMGDYTRTTRYPQKLWQNLCCIKTAR